MSSAETQGPDCSLEIEGLVEEAGIVAAADTAQIGLLKLLVLGKRGDCVFQKLQQISSFGACGCHLDQAKTPLPSTDQISFSDLVTYVRQLESCKQPIASSDPAPVYQAAKSVHGHTALISQLVASHDKTISGLDINKSFKGLKAVIQGYTPRAGQVDNEAQSHEAHLLVEDLLQQNSALAPEKAGQLAAQAFDVECAALRTMVEATETEINNLKQQRTALFTDDIPEFLKSHLGQDNARARTTARQKCARAIADSLAGLNRLRSRFDQSAFLLKKIFLVRLQNRLSPMEDFPLRC